jgi:glycosyltransferase involved in cell wall biosynthesis
VKIGIVATHSFPIPWKTHTGDVVILDLAAGLAKLGHQVNVYAPVGTKVPEGCQLLDMPCAFGKYPPPGEQCERECFEKNKGVLMDEDVVHDFSVCKQVAWGLVRMGKRNVVGTPLGGTWRNLTRPMNVAVWSRAMRGRGMRGASDYEGTDFKEWADDNQPKIFDAKVVYGGIDCELHDDLNDGLRKKGFLLWMNRWHPAKGWRMAIELARETGCELVMAGEHPDNETYEFQRMQALEALHLAKGLGNVHFEFLPPDPDHHERKRQLYCEAKALLYTVQFHEPFGLSQVEAMASWTPVVGTRMGSVPEVVDHGLSGLVCDNNVASLAEAVERVGDIKPKVCRETAVRRFSRMVMAQDYLGLYEDVTEGRSWG